VDSIGEWRGHDVRMPWTISEVFIVRLVVFLCLLSFGSFSWMQTLGRRTFHASVRMKKYAPSQFVLDEDGSKWRIAVACAVLNSKNELLVGERIHIPDNWQAPQGGVDDAWEENSYSAETTTEAASRELYEETGLQTNQDVLILQDQDTSIKPVRYETNGSNNWLTKSGFSGQELHWVIFRCANARGDTDAAFMCDLEGQNGEAPEFSNVQWKSIDWVVENMWPAKRGPYETLHSSFGAIVKKWRVQCQTIDFTGTWARDSSLNENVTEALIKRGVSADKAASEAGGPYVQKWSRRDGRSAIWNVKTYGENNEIRRDLVRKIEHPWIGGIELTQRTNLLFGLV
jgi:putative (di)nucleoside polyphosphate hydrolase